MPVTAAGAHRCLACEGVDIDLPTESQMEGLMMPRPVSHLGIAVSGLGRDLTRSVEVLQLLHSTVKEE